MPLLEPMRCPECHAPIAVDDGATQVRCAFCKARFRVVRDPATSSEVVLKRA